MRGATLRLVALAAPICLSAGCGKAPDSAQEATADQAGTDITGSSAARGVAFQFSYDFILPARAISKVQRQHVAQCEQLGLARCRVSGIRYDQRSPTQAAGSLDLLLAPSDAYRFASNAIGIVEAGSGQIDKALVEGSDAQSTIVQAQEQKGDVETEIQRAEARLKDKGLTRSERDSLNAQIEQWRRQALEQAQTQRSAAQSLAISPVHFGYDSQGALHGENRFIRAVAQSWSGLVDMIILAVIVLGYAIPWLLIGGAIIFGLRKVGRIRERKAETPE